MLVTILTAMTFLCSGCAAISREVTNPRIFRNRRALHSGYTTRCTPACRILSPQFFAVYDYVTAFKR